MLTLTGFIARCEVGAEATLEFSENLDEGLFTLVEKSVLSTSPEAMVWRYRGQNNKVFIYDSGVSFDRIAKDIGEVVDEAIFPVASLIDKDSIIIEVKFPMTMQQFGEHITGKPIL